MSTRQLSPDVLCTWGRQCASNNHRERIEYLDMIPANLSAVALPITGTTVLTGVFLIVEQYNHTLYKQVGFNCTSINIRLCKLTGTRVNWINRKKISSLPKYNNEYHIRSRFKLDLMFIGIIESTDIFYISRRSNQKSRLSKFVHFYNSIVPYILSIYHNFSTCKSITNYTAR